VSRLQYGKREKPRLVKEGRNKGITEEKKKAKGESSDQANIVHGKNIWANISGGSGLEGRECLLKTRWRGSLDNGNL